MKRSLEHSRQSTFHLYVGSLHAFSVWMPKHWIHFNSKGSWSRIICRDIVEAIDNFCTDPVVCPAYLDEDEVRLPIPIDAQLITTGSTIRLPESSLITYEYGFLFDGIDVNFIPVLLSVMNRWLSTWYAKKRADKITDVPFTIAACVELTHNPVVNCANAEYTIMINITLPYEIINGTCMCEFGPDFDTTFTEICDTHFEEMFSRLIKVYTY